MGSQLAILEQPDAASLIVVEGSVIDLGNTLQGAEIEQVVHLANCGKSPVRILTMRPECGCTIAHFERDLLLPGERTQLALRWHVGSSQGHVTSATNLAYQETDKPDDLRHLQVTLSTFVQPDFEVDRNALWFEASEGKQVQEIVLSPAFMEQLEIMSATSANDAFSVSRIATTAHRTVVAVEFNPDKWEATSRRSFVTIETNSHRRRFVHIQLYVETLRTVSPQ
jgi:hypothetical protein